MSQPTDLAQVLRRAAEIIVTNGHHQGDYLPDPFNRVLKALPTERPMSAVAALRCAESGNPMQFGPLSTAAIRFLAGRLLVDGEPPFYTDDLMLELHVAAWGDVPCRTPGEVVAVLLWAADAAEAARVAVVPVGVRTADGSQWALAAVDSAGTPRYVSAGGVS
jgi:hypothetical protein